MGLSRSGLIPTLGHRVRPLSRKGHDSEDLEDGFKGPGFRCHGPVTDTSGAFPVQLVLRVG